MTAPADDLRLRSARLQRRAWIVALLGGLAAGIGGFLDPAQFYRSWLLGFLLLISLPLGSLGLGMLHHLTGGSWGFAIRRLLEASTRTLPLFVLLFLPVVLGMHELYEWTHPEGDPVLEHKAPYLNTPFFLVRAAFYFAVWLGLAGLLGRLSTRYDRSGASRLVRRMRMVSGPGLGLYALTVTFAATDWAMSLEPHWFSTIYGVMFIVGQVLATLAFTIVVSRWLSLREPFSRWLSDDHFHDLGKLLFTFVMLWAYVAFSQYLIVWSGNLAEETPWYQHRSSHGWQGVAQFLIAFHFALPFLVLLSRKTKRNPRALAAVALWLLLLRWVDLTWLIVPAFSEHGGGALHWMDVVLPLAMGGLWVGFFFKRLEGRPLISLQDASLHGALELGAAEGGAGPATAQHGHG